jgi:hypothetical protein
MKSLLIAIAATMPFPDLTCTVFTDGERLYDFEFHDNVRIVGEQCDVSCDDGECYFDCPTHHTGVVLGFEPLAMDMTTGYFRPLEPVCGDAAKPPHGES